jgi:hypothetical protein
MAGEPREPEEWAELSALGESLVPTGEELAEARLLAVAAEGKQQKGLSQDVEVGLGLLRVATEGELGPDAKARIWAELPLTEKSVVKPQFERIGRTWLVFAGLLPVGLAAFLYWQDTTGELLWSRKVAHTAVPEPKPTLLAAQAQWVSANEREPFEQNMSSYRLAVLEGLE